jgi:Na+/H+ antiporter NhaA
MRTLSLGICVVVAFCMPAHAFAQDAGPDNDQGTSSRPVAVEVSDAYQLRAKIHKIASFAILPLFGAEWALGQKLYDGTADSSARGAHSAVAAGIGGLFAVNSVTGVWNLVDAWKSPEHRGKKLLHGILMLTADTGFFATAATAPDHERAGVISTDGRQTHRAIAITTIGVATVGYMIMLFGDN